MPPRDDTHPTERPTETSPLLPKAPGLVDPSIGNAPGNSTLEESGLLQNDLSALGRTVSAIDRERHYVGLPEERKRLYRLLPALSIGIFLAAADQTIIVSSAGKISSDLDALQKRGWIATAYFITLTSFQPLYGKLSDIFSRKGCLLFAYLVFGLGTLACGLARTIDELIIARAIAGIGGGGMTTVVSILLSDIIPLKERGTWQGYLNIIFASGAGFGAPMGGLFADGPGWRWAFLLQAPLCLIAFISVGTMMKSPPREPRSDEEGTETTEEAKMHWTSKLKRIDFLGSITLIAAVVNLLVGFDRGSNVAWGSADCLVPLCVSFPLFALFAFIEFRVSSEPIAPSRIIFERTLFACFACNLFSFAGYMATIFGVPLYYQAAKGYSTWTSSLLLLPSVIAGVSGSLFAGAFMQRYGTYRVLTVVCYLNLTLGLFFIVMFTGVIVDSDVGISLALACTGFSNGIGVTSTLIALISNAARDDQAIATACSYLFRSLGSTTGVALSTTAANQTLREALKKALSSGKDADKIIEGVRRSLLYIDNLEPHMRDIVRQCYALSSRASFILQLCLVSGAFVSALFIKEKPLSG